MTNVPTNPDALPDWWAREKRRRQGWVLFFLLLLLILIAFFYWVSFHGRVGIVNGVDFPTSNYIAFINQDKDGNSTLYAIKADGSDLRRLTPEADKSNKLEPAWTTDGKVLLYASNRGDNKVTQIYLLGGGEPRQLTYGAGNKFTPFVNPDGKRAAFITQGAVKTQLLNGEDVQQVMPPPRAGNSDSGEGMPEGMGDPRGPFLKAAFAADGRGIAGVQSLSGEGNPTTIGNMIMGDQVARALPPESDHALTLNTGREIGVAWEPNGSRLAVSFTESEVKNEQTGQTQMFSGVQIWAFEKDKPKESVPVFVAMGHTVEPKNVAWSPDGKHIVFECWRLQKDGVRELMGLYMMDISTPILVKSETDVASLRFLVPSIQAGKPQNPHWSADGSRLLFEMARTDGGRDICIVNADGTTPLNLTQKLGGDNSNASWSPAP